MAVTKKFLKTKPEVQVTFEIQPDSTESASKVYVVGEFAGWEPVELKKLKSGLINGQAVDVNKTYYIATSDYLALGGDNMKFFSKGEIITTGLRMRDVFMEYFKKNPEIKTSSEIRLNFIGKTNE